MRRKIKRGSMLAAAFLLLVLAAVPKTVYGAPAIDTERKDCSMTFTLSSDPGEEADSQKIPVVLYRVAGIKADGTYEAENGYEEIGLDRTDADTTAAEWVDMAAAAARAAAPEALDEDGRIVAQELPDGSRVPYRELEAGAQRADGLETGMYLVMALAADSPEYTCVFAPYLVSLPGNDYYETGEDTWNYEVDVTLKPDRIDRFGSLQITKELPSYLAGSGASFIFQIEAQKAVSGVQTTVYSNVVQLAFDAPGSQSLVIEDRIPAGASVTVTEIYQGSAYEAAGGEVRTAQMTADDTVSVEFANTYNGQLNSGSSIVNHFESVPGTAEDGTEAAGSWQWTQQ